MKFQTMILAVASGTLLVACGGKAPETVDATQAANPAVADQTHTSYAVSSENSELTWKGSKLAYDHSGVVSISSGTLHIEEGVITAGNFTIDMTSITETGNPDTAGAAKLVMHLKSPDFFHVDSFPTAGFEITGTTPLEGDSVNNCTIMGNLTILGQSHNIQFPANAHMHGDNMHTRAAFAIDRTQWGIHYASGTLLGDAADKIIADEIEFTVNLTATKQ